MNRFALVVYSILVLGTSGCANFPPAPGDPFKGILSDPPKDAAQKGIPDASQKKLGIILSDNTNASFKWLLGTIDRNKGGSFEQLTQLWNPSNFAERTAGVLRKHFADVRVMNDMNDLRKMQLDYASVVDVVFSTIPTGLGERWTYQFQTHFLNRAGERVGVAEGKQSSTVNFVAQCGLSYACISKVQAAATVELMDKTFQSLDTSISQAIHK